MQWKSPTCTPPSLARLLYTIFEISRPSRGFHQGLTNMFWLTSSTTPSYSLRLIKPRAKRLFLCLVQDHVLGQTRKMPELDTCRASVRPLLRIPTKRLRSTHLPISLSSLQIWKCFLSISQQALLLFFFLVLSDPISSLYFLFISQLSLSSLRPHCSLKWKKALLLSHFSLISLLLLTLSRATTHTFLCKNPNTALPQRFSIWKFSHDKENANQLQPCRFVSCKRSVTDPRKNSQTENPLDIKHGPSWRFWSFDYEGNVVTDRSVGNKVDGETSAAIDKNGTSF